MQLELLAHGRRPALRRALLERGHVVGRVGGGLFNSSVMMNLPRMIGEVRLEAEVSDRMLPCPSRPYRFGSSTSTRRKREPYTPRMP
jgi:hypothetical protein